MIGGIRLDRRSVGHYFKKMSQTLAHLRRYRKSLFGLWVFLLLFIGLQPCNVLAQAAAGTAPEMAGMACGPSHMGDGGKAAYVPCNLPDIAVDGHHDVLHAPLPAVVPVHAVLVPAFSDSDASAATVAHLDPPHPPDRFTLSKIRLLI